MNGHFLEGYNLFWTYYSIGLRYHDQEIEQLKALLISHVGTYLMTTVLYHRTIFSHAQALLLLEKLEQDFFTLLLRLFSEILTQKTAHQLHF